jgi:hypothetical protein
VETLEHIKVYRILTFAPGGGECTARSGRRTPIKNSPTPTLLLFASSGVGKKIYEGVPGM